MGRLVAIHGGGDWYDASADYLILPDGMDITVEKAAREKWYKEVYTPTRRMNTHIVYLTLDEWCIQRGARKPTEDELLIVDDTY